MRGHIHQGVIVPDDPAELPEGALVQFEVVYTSNDELPPPRRQGGQWRGQVQLADDFDVLPDDIAEALGMKSP